MLGIVLFYRCCLFNIINFINGGSWFNENDFVKNICGFIEL